MLESNGNFFPINMYVSNISYLELWLSHCLSIKEIRDEHQNGSHRNPEEWREMYLVRQIRLLI